MTTSKIAVPRDEKGIFGRLWVSFFNTVANRIKIINNTGEIKLVDLSDAEASNESLYFSTDQNKPVWKDSVGVVNDLY